VPDPEDVESEEVAQLRDRFFWQVHEVGLAGEFVVEPGNVPRVVCDRGRWNDLVVLPITYPPGRQPLHYLGSGLRQVIARCSRPMLAVPAVTAMQNVLLVYNGSAESEEALFIATYLAARWQIGLAVVIVANAGDSVDEMVALVRSYLEEHGILAAIEVKTAPEVEAALAVTEEHGCDLIVIGGYSQQPVVELVAGSVLTELLRTAQQPILIAR
jgi:nucleotide-binding universal stress UspA family protein